jgi:hypothetical protein
MRAATALLANAAEVREGLLYVLGGGVEELWVGELPAQVAPSVVVVLELDDADLGRSLAPHLTVTDPVGDALVDVDLPPAVADRTPGGTDEVAQLPMVFTVGMQVAREGVHRLQLTVDGDETASLRFAVRVS